VVASSSEAEAQTLVGAITPDVVIADARWLQPDLLLWLGKEPERPQPSIIAIHESATASIHSASLHVIACLAKPVDAVELRRAVQAQLVKAAPDLWFSLANYIQLACQERRSLQLAVTSNESSGVVTIEQGQVWSASYNGMSGFAALAWALDNSDAQVALWSPLICASPREIAGDWPMLQSSATQLCDETAWKGRPQRPLEQELDFSDVLVSSIVPNSVVIESGQKLRSGRGGYESLIIDAVAATLKYRYTDALQLFEEATEIAPHSLAIGARITWLRSLLKGVPLSKDA
jgi:hypothetical protein